MANASGPRPVAGPDDDEPIGGTYSGPTKQGLRHGHGRYVYGNEFFAYEGDWVQGIKHGKGKFMLGDGSVYEGDFANGEIDGWGTRTWPSGATYSGHFTLGEMHGNGIYIGPDGAQYEGDFRENKKHGRGRVTSVDGSVFEGEFVDNRQSGQGTLTMPDGWTYTGEWRAGERHGLGRVHWPDGSRYEGGFAASAFDGYGVFDTGESLETRRVYDGEWQAGRPVELEAALVFQGQLQIEGAPAAELPDDNKSAGRPSSRKSEKPDKQRPATPGVTKSGTIVLVPGMPVPALVVQVVDRAGKAMGGHSGRTIRAALRRYAVPEKAKPGKKGGKGGDSAAGAPAAAPGVLSELELGRVVTVSGHAFFDQPIVLPEDYEVTSIERECEVVFTDETTPEHSSLLPPATLPEMVSPVSVNK